jgi:hypothetical protein
MKQTKASAAAPDEWRGFYGADAYKFVLLAERHGFLLPKRKQ